MIDIIIPTLGADRCILETISSLDNWKPLVGKIIIVSKSNEIYQILCVRDSLDNIEIILGGHSVYSAMNLGLRAATSEYVYFIGEGDKVHPLGFYIEKSLTDGCDLLLAGVNYIDEDNATSKTLPRFLNFRKPYFLSLLVNSGWPHQGMILSRKLHREFDDRYSIVADQINLFKLSRKIKKIIWSSKIISDFNTGGISSDKEKRRLEWMIFYNEFIQSPELSMIKKLLIRIRLCFL